MIVDLDQAVLTFHSLHGFASQFCQARSVYPDQLLKYVKSDGVHGKAGSFNDYILSVNLVDRPSEVTQAFCVKVVPLMQLFNHVVFLRCCVLHQ
ncbi:hypothetical protein D9M73_174690 [compost metagenome]